LKPDSAQKEMPGCLIVSRAAREFAEEISRTADSPVPVTDCTSAEEALDNYADQSILFGNPDMIAKILPELPNVDWVQSTWAGITPLISIDRRDYILTGVKGVFGPQISEYVMGYLLAHELQVIERMRQQRMRNWFAATSGGLQGRRLGIMGTGSIGAHIARTSKAFGMNVAGLSLSGTASPAFDQVMPVTQLHEFLKEIDYLIVTLPATAGTENLLDAAAFEKLPAHAYLINVGRSNIVHDEALVNALYKNELAGAALDVFDDEPLPEESLLWDAPNLSITAHIAAISHPSLIVPIFLENYRRYCGKQPLKHVIDFDKGY
jgi:phosphoglycerate dehydrogenase-like enzyme